MTILTGEEILASLSDYEDEVDLAKFARAIEAAVLAKVDELRKAERERCACISDEEAGEWGTNQDGWYACRNVSEAIRSLK